MYILTRGEIRRVEVWWYDKASRPSFFFYRGIISKRLTFHELLRLFTDRKRRGGPVPQPDYVYSNLIHKAYYLDVQHEHCLPPLKVSAGQVDPEALRDRFCFNSRFTELVGRRGATGSESYHFRVVSSRIAGCQNGN